MFKYSFIIIIYLIRILLDKFVVKIKGEIFLVIVCIWENWSKIMWKKVNIWDKLMISLNDKINKIYNK